MRHRLLLRPIDFETAYAAAHLMIGKDLLSTCFEAAHAAAYDIHVVEHVPTNFEAAYAAAYGQEGVPRVVP